MLVVAITDCDAPIENAVSGYQAKHDLLMRAHDALLAEIQQHPWSIDWSTLRYSYDCSCAACDIRHSLRHAVLAYAEALLFAAP